MSYALGVDLGTTFTAAATANGAGPSMIGLGNRALQVPSVLFLDADHFLVGESAERRGAIEPDRLVREFKRRLGDHVPLLVGGSPFSAELLTARLLGWVMSTTSERMGEPPETVVLTHPANWGPFKMEVFRQVSTLADVPNVTWIPEPVAAAAQYASRARVEVGEKLAIYDLGGGTFDVCIVEKTADGGFRMLGNPDGVEHLGGTDLDHALFERVMASLADRVSDLDPDDPELAIGLNRLRRDCVDAKEALSSDVTAIIPVALPGLSTSVRMTRSEFEELIRPSLLETLAATRRGLSSAGVEPSELAAVVLIGGSSRIPLVGELLQHEFGIPVALDTHPKHDVALGAARLASASDAAAASIPEAATSTPNTPKAAASTAKAATPAARPPEATSGQTAAPAAPVVPVAPAAPVDRTAADRAAADLAAADSGGTPSPPKGPLLTRTRVIAGLVAVIVIVTFVVLLATGALFRSGGGPSQPTTPQNEPSPSSDTQSPAGSPAGLPQSAEALGDSVIVWPRAHDGNWDIATLDTATGAENPLTTSSEEDSFPVISRDRRTIIYVRRGAEAGLRVISADGNDDRKLFAQHPAGCGTVSRPAWHETTLAVVCESTADPGTSILGLVTLDGTMTIELDHGTMGDPTFTPDGTAVVYWKTLGKGDTGLFSVATDGKSAPIRLTNAADADAVVSPDGKQLAFRRQLAGPRVIMTMPFDGRRATGEPIAQTDGPNDQDPSWSPDGKSIAYKHGPNDNADLWVVDLESGESRQLVDNPEPDTTPAWTTR